VNGYKIIAVIIMTNRYFTISNIVLITIAVYFSISGFYKVATYRLDPVPPSRVAGDRQISSVEDEPSQNFGELFQAWGARHMQLLKKQNQGSKIFTK
jgi:hypothetical protein